MAQDAVQPGQALVLGQRLVFIDLGLPPVQPPEPPGSGGNGFHIMLFQQVAGIDSLAESKVKRIIAGCVFAEAGENNVAGEEAVRGGVAGGHGLALGRFGTGLAFAEGAGNSADIEAFRKGHGVACFLVKSVRH